MGPRRLTTLVVLAAWVLLGPLALVFGVCAGMEMMCEGPCGLTTCAGLTATSATAPLPVASLEAPPSDHLSTFILKTPDPPPKSAPLAA